MNLTAFYGWVAQHPDFAGLAVFLIAMAESLAVIGLIVPGVAMMFAAGALVGTGALAFEPICGYAVAGAITGDGLSFWVGWHYRSRVGSLWPFTRYPGMIDRGVAFFRRYGGFSVLFGRFVGPVRAVIPLVAGMLAMPVRQFLVINVLSALLWGPAYLLPGVVFGASLDLAARVAGRLAALILALLALSWLTLWLSRRLYAYFRPRTHRFILLSFDLCKAHPGFSRLATPLIEANQRDYAGLLAWAVILSAVGLMASTLISADLLAVSLEAWRNPVADYALAIGQDLGELPAVLGFSAVVAIWLLFRGRRIALTHLLVGLGFAAGLGMLSAIMFTRPLVDGPVLNGAVAYGFTAVLLAGWVPATGRWLAYGAAALLAVTIAFARLYFGDGQLLGVGFTLALASIWLILLGTAYRRHSPEEAPAESLVWLAPFTLGAIGVILWCNHFLEEFRYHAPRIAVSQQEWLTRGWHRLPAQRAQNFGRPEEPLAVQWAASLETVRATLTRHGWREAKPLDLGPALRILNPEADIAELPVLPHFNHADADALRLIRPISGGRWLIVRFWPSGFELADPSVPIWVGRVAFLEAQEFLGLLKLLDETGDDSEALRLFAAELRSYLPAIVQGRGEAVQAVLVPPETP